VPVRQTCVRFPQLTLTAGGATRYRARSVAETSLGEIAACLWDLRAQCEQAMRTLTDAQRLTEDYRDADRHQNLVRRRLLADVQAVLQTTAAIKDAAQDCLALVEQLPHDESIDG
jgi:hypothetical protein